MTPTYLSACTSPCATHHISVNALYKYEDHFLVAPHLRSHFNPAEASMGI